LRNLKNGILKALLLAGATFATCTAAQAAEKGLGVYLLGLKGPLAGVVPAPGVYLQNDTYYYQGGTGASGRLPTGDSIGVGIKANAIVDLPTLIWPMPQEMLGGRPAIAVTAPFGRQSVEADLVVGPRSFDTRSTTAAVGDPLVTAMLGWNRGNLHWNVSAMVNLPVGDYREQSMANIAFHRWAGDFSLAATWLDAELGLDISGVAGFTFNGANRSTGYRTGTEFHFEGAVSKALTPQFSLGVAGYYYQQISDDRPRLGVDLDGYRGRVAALGGTASYMFEANKTPIVTRLRVFREFHAKNRQQGTAAFLTLLVPLHTSTQQGQ